MSLKDQINQDMKAAMREKDQGTLRAIRAIKAAILNAEVAEGRNGEPLTDKEEIQLLSKQAKQRRDSMTQYKENGRDELAEKEAEELAVIERYLPQQLSEAEIEAKLKEIIAQVGASTPNDMGKVMGVASKTMAGQADGKVMSGMVRRLLSE